MDAETGGRGAKDWESGHSGNLCGFQNIVRVDVIGGFPANGPHFLIAFPNFDAALLIFPSEKLCATMSEQAEYLWLEQQGEAFGAPGLGPRWTSSVKDAVGTAYSASSRVWFTCSHGILNEIYHPTIDSAQVRDMEFLVTDGETFAHEEKRDLLTTFEYIDAEALGVRYINSDPDG